VGTTTVRSAAVDLEVALDFARVERTLLSVAFEVLSERRSVVTIFRLKKRSESCLAGFSD
jgi:hypothetical protein